MCTSKEEEKRAVIAVISVVVVIEMVMVMLKGAARGVVMFIKSLRKRAPQ